MIANSLVYVGTYTEPIRFGTGQLLEGKGEGIYAFELDRERGKLTPHGLTRDVRNPSYLCFDRDRRHLYAVNELKEFEGKPTGAVSAFGIDQETGALVFLNSRSTGGTDPCHLAVDRTGKFVAVANFMSGSVSVFPVLSDGSLGEACSFIQHEGSSVDPVRQRGPHAHAIEFDTSGQFVFVPDLGLDKVLIYRLDQLSGKLTPGDPPWISTAGGAGPRQLVMHPNNVHAYLINEINSTMTAYRFDSAHGTFAELQTVSTLPDAYQDHSTCAEVQITADGRFLYGSNRGHDSIAIFSISDDGVLKLVGHESCRGCVPRNFEIDRRGEYLIAANQDTNNLIVFKINPANGDLIHTGGVATVPTPICVRFA